MTQSDFTFVFDLKKTFSMEDWDSLENVFDKQEMVTEIFQTALEM